MLVLVKGVERDDVAHTALNTKLDGISYYFCDKLRLYRLGNFTLTNSNV